MNLFFRKLTDKYQKDNYMFLEEIEGGVKSDLEEMITTRLSQMLDEVKFDWKEDCVIKAGVVFGMDGSGNHVRIQGQNLQDGIDMSSQIFGGICIIYIKDPNHETIYEEQSQGPESVTPWFLVNGQESEARVEQLCNDFIDDDIEYCKTLTFGYGDIIITAKCHFIPAFDGKTTRV